VLDLSRLYPGAFCTLLLADLGADVLKVEAPGAGDGMRMMAAPGEFNAAHTALNRGKRSLALDLRQPEAVEVLKSLVRWADVVIESHKPGQLDGFGLGYEVMSVENPRVVWCSLTGFGDFGPNAQAAGHDITYLGYSGLLGRLADGPATPPAAPISLPLAGTMAVAGVLAALLHAERSGEGARLDVNMVDSAMWTLSEDVARAASDPGPGWGTMAARNVYACSDGREVTVASNEPRTWALLCDALGLPELLAHRIGIDDDAAATAKLVAVFATRPASDWLTTPGLAGGVGPVNGPEDLLVDPQVVARGSLAALDRLPGDTPTAVLANPIRWHSRSGIEASCGLGQPPELGAHTVEALGAAGIDPDEIARWVAGGVIV
jgi:crotonobetainyl-CoA:carnitine CoA-transferase CaiB-like acyl-CoA transferase